jgi:hypothetical protein
MQIGITGLANGGKTVFLTSLLWHLSELGASDFILDGNVGLTDFRERPFREKGVDLFPFEEYRDALVRGGVWPSKTTDCYKYSCVFVREDWTRIGFRRINRMRKLKLSTHQYFNFFDFGGERIADAAIAGYKEYADWSDHMFRHFRSHADYRQAVGGYLKILEKLMSIEHNGYDEVVHSYKLTLSALIHGYKPLISPSTFLLDTSGSVAAPASDEALAESRFSGLDKDCQFAPLPSDFRQKYPAVAHKCQNIISFIEKRLHCRYSRKLENPRGWLFLLIFLRYWQEVWGVIMIIARLCLTCLMHSEKIHICTNFYINCFHFGPEILRRWHLLQRRRILFVEMMFRMVAWRDCCVR